MERKQTSDERANVVPVETVNMAAATLEVTDVVRNLRLIQRVLKEVLVEGPNRDYGSPPGTTGKVLYKAGAEKLGMLFRLAPTYVVEVRELGGDHRDVSVRCELRHIGTGAKVAEGVGSCSTREKKYRWRYVYEHGRRTNNRTENEDLADVWNTVLKQAKKRAHVDAMLTAIAASDMFTQDLEDDEGHGAPAGGGQDRRASGPKQNPEWGRARHQLRGAWERLRQLGVDKRDFLASACSVHGGAVRNPFDDLTIDEMDNLRELCEERIARLEEERNAPEQDSEDEGKEQGEDQGEPVEAEDERNASGDVDLGAG